MSDARSSPPLLVVVDLPYAGSVERWLALLREVGACARSAPVAVQARAKGLPPDETESLAARAREAVPDGALLVWNGDAALAERLGFEGVHWPEAAIPPAPASSLRWRSAAVHWPSAIAAAEAAEATALVFGAVFQPGSKDGVPLGLEVLQTVCASTRVPVYAIGGVTPERAAACLEAGAAGVAVVSGVLDAPSVGGAIEAYLGAMGTVQACR